MGSYSICNMGWKKKGIMIKACEKAKLFNKNTNKGTFFALEPEAASFYCS